MIVERFCKNLLVSVGVALVAAFCSIPLDAKPLSGTQVVPSERISRVLSGAWNESGDLLYVLDSSQKTILQITLQGAVSRLPADVAKHWAGAYPTMLQAIDTGFLVQVKQPVETLLFFDHNFNYDHEVEMVSRSEEDSQKLNSLGSIYRWAAADGKLFAFVDLQQSLPPWTSTFVEIPFESPESFTSLFDLRLSIGDPMRSYNRAGLNYIAVTKDSAESQGPVAYILVMDDPLYIVEVSPVGASYIGNLKIDCQDRVAISSSKGPEGMLRVYQAIEGAPGPLGLLAAENSVFFLCKKSVSDLSVFSLYRFDPANGSHKDEMVFETTATNLTVVPGPKWWAFIEMGPTELVHDVVGGTSNFEAPVQSVNYVSNFDFGDLNVPPKPSPSTTGFSDVINLSWWVQLLFGGFGLALLAKLRPRFVTFYKWSMQRLHRYIRVALENLLDGLGGDGESKG